MFKGLCEAVRHGDAIRKRAIHIDRSEYLHKTSSKIGSRIENQVSWQKLQRIY